MTRNQSTQRQRTAQNPLLIGSFDQTSLRVLTGTLGALNKVSRLQRHQSKIPMVAMAVEP